MKVKHVFPAIGTLMLFACNPAPKATGPMGTPATAVAPADTVINRYERKEEAQIKRDTAKVAADPSAVKAH